MTTALQGVVTQLYICSPRRRRRMSLSTGLCICAFAVPTTCGITRPEELKPQRTPRRRGRATRRTGPLCRGRNPPIKIGSCRRRSLPYGVHQRNAVNEVAHAVSNVVMSERNGNSLGNHTHPRRLEVDSRTRLKRTMTRCSFEQDVVRRQ